MTYLAVYIGVGLLLFVTSNGSNVVRRATESLESFCWVLGALIVWPVILVKETREMLEQEKYNAEQGNPEHGNFIERYFYRRALNRVEKNRATKQSTTESKEQ